MNRFIITCCIFFSSSAYAQQGFHWELTNGPATDAPSILEVNTNGDIIVGTGNVILRSSDHGVHWYAFPNSGVGNVEASVTLPEGRIVVLVYDSMVRFESDGSGRTTLTLPNAETLYADRSGNLYSIVGPSDPFFHNGTDSLLARSTNAGDTWQMIPGPKSESMECFAADEEHYYVATDSGIYISSDSGTTWQRCLNGVPTNQYYDVTTGHNGHVWATSLYLGPFLSTDFGNTWRQIQDRGGLAYKIAARTDNKAIGFGLNSLTYLVDTTSTLVTNPLSGNELLAAVDSDGMWMGAGVNLYSSTGGAPWVWNPISAPLSSPSSLTQAYSTVIAQAGSGRYFIDSENNWNRSGADSITLLGLDYFNNSLLGSTSKGGLDQSFDTGRSWKNIFPAGPPEMTYGATANASTIYAGSAGVFRSSDSGNSWSETNDNLLTSQITALAVDSSGTLFAGNAHGLFMSTDSGNSWEKQTEVGTIEINLIEANKIGTIAVGGLGSKVFRSTDQGVSWNSVTIPSANQVTGIALLPTGDVFASSSAGVFYWPIGSAVFYDANDSLQGRGVTALGIDAKGTLFVATNGVGVWKSVGDLSFLGGTEHASKIANISASPNPASSIVRFALPSEGTWSVVAMDALGREWPMPYSVSGENLECDLRMFPAGAYELLLRSGSMQIVSRVQVVR